MVIALYWLLKGAGLNSAAVVLIVAAFATAALDFAQRRVPIFALTTATALAAGAAHLWTLAFASILVLVLVLAGIPLSLPGGDVLALITAAVAIAGHYVTWLLLLAGFAFAVLLIRNRSGTHPIAGSLSLSLGILAIGPLL